MHLRFLIVLILISSFITCKEGNILKSKHLKTFLRMLKKQDQSPENREKCEKPINNYLLFEDDDEALTDILEVAGYRELGTVTYKGESFRLNHASLFLSQSSISGLEGIHPMRLRFRGVSTKRQAIFEINFEEFYGEADEQPNHHNRYMANEMIKFDMESEKLGFNISPLQELLDTPKSTLERKVKIPSHLCLETIQVKNKYRKYGRIQFFKHLRRNIKLLRDLMVEDPSLKSKQTTIISFAEKKDELVQTLETMRANELKKHAFEKVVFGFLDKMVSFIDKRYNGSVKDTNKAAYHKIKEEGIKKIINDANNTPIKGLAMEKSEILAAPKFPRTEANISLLNDLLNEFKDSPSAQAVLLKLEASH